VAKAANADALKAKSASAPKANAAKAASADAQMVESADAPKVNALAPEQRNAPARAETAKVAHAPQRREPMAVAAADVEATKPIARRRAVVEVMGEHRRSDAGMTE
jgi:hypothetical protein